MRLRAPTLGATLREPIVAMPRMTPSTPNCSYNYQYNAIAGIFTSHTTPQNSIDTIDGHLDDYLNLAREDALAALEYAATLAKEEISSIEPTVQGS